jgi:microcin C transport system ATP-binding protein
MSAAAVQTDSLLEVRNLRVAYRDEGRTVPIVDGASFTLGRGEALGLAG